MKNFEALYVSRWRLVVLGLLIVVAMMILLTRLWNVQMQDYGAANEKIYRETTVSERLSPARGSILDRNGVPLAENRASFDVDFYLDELVRQYRRQHRGYLPRIGVRRKQGKKWVDREEPNFAEIVKEGVDQLSQVLGSRVDLNAKELQEHYYRTPNIPYQYRANINFETLARFSEHSLGLPGVDISVRPIRYYPYGALAAHILGYVGKPPEQDQSGTRDYETIGRSGIEASFDDHLQGTPGGRISRINSKGYIVDEQSYNPPTVGASLYLTLDSRIQYICEQAVRKFNVGRGAFVVMDPNNGDILAMVSVPSYDPNAFIPKIDPAKWKDWNSDPTSPLLNRTVQGYSSGSTFKILVAAAALKNGVITPTTLIDCPAAYQIGNRLYHNAESQVVGDFDLHQAIVQSINVFFYQLAIRTKIEAIDAMGEIVGFGQKTGLPIPESAGVLPGPDWLSENKPKETWSTAYTALTAIGQQYVLVTPVQMAVLISSVANGGTVYAPRLVTGLSDLEGENIASFPSKIRNHLGLKPDDLAAIRSAMLGVVNEEAGTAHIAKIDGVNIAGKTGTADHYAIINHTKKNDKITWFASFGPYEQPRYTIVGVVEGGYFGGYTVGPIVKDIYQQIFAMEKSGVSPTLTYLTPTIGNFKGAADYTPAPDTNPGGMAPANADQTGNDSSWDPFGSNDGQMTPSTVKRSINRASSH